MRIAILDDYQDVALTLADWSQVQRSAEITVFNDHVADMDTVAARLEPFEVVAIMRERTPFPGELLARLPNLKLLVTAGMRNLSIDLEAATERGVIVSGTDNVGVTTAELAWGLILGLARRIPEEDRATRAGQWQTSVGISIGDKTLGIIGLGKVGGHVAKIGLAFGMDVIAWSQNLTPERCAEVGVRLATKEELFATADFLSIHLVLSDRTRGLVGRDELALMKPSAYLVNTARGPIVQQEALVEALEAGVIGGAGIDVYEPEPLPKDHPMRSLPRSIITPHLGFVTDTNYKLWYGQIAEDIAAWMDGKPLRVLNPDALG
ncbi:MAG: D-2-hydroxyacid dehydrogenase family protein [Alphaproteobacteria bacterium]|nr:D-2-hydroxyacid dehydrogenase family protein [Alphaproteobacteria bacterium]